MSLPHAELVAKLKSLTAVQAIVGTKVFPIIVPQIDKYPAIVYQVIGNTPENFADGTTGTFTMRVRVTCLSLTTAGQQGYTNAWALAEAVIGNCDPIAPTGLAGWVDPSSTGTDKRVWQLEECFDEIGVIMRGRDQFEAFVVNEIYLVQYAIGG